MNVTAQSSVDNAVFAEDGDMEFLRVDTRRAPHTLEPGVFAEATNQRSEYGQLWPRQGISRQPWGNVNDGGATCGFARFNDPNGVDTCILVTDDWRDDGDGGRGRAWRIQSGNAAQEIPLNGHDIWGETRLIACFNGVVALRQGEGRHYFSASAVSSDAIALNCTPSFITGDRVLFVQVGDSSITSSSQPNNNTKYWANVSGSTVTLYNNSANAIAGGSTGKILMTSAVGKFYLQLAKEQPGFYGNGAVPLLMQGSATESAFEAGFESVPVNVAATSTAATDILTAPNHRFIPGDAVKITGTLTAASGALAGTTRYARPLNEHELQLYTSEEYALAGGSTGREDLSTDGQTPTLAKAGANGLPMPPAREGIYFKNRLILVSGQCNLTISDPLDPLHFSPFAAEIAANLGESEPINWLQPLGDDTLLIGKGSAVLGITGLSGASTGWALTEVTREYGGIAPLAVCLVGSDCWFLSRRGIASVAQTIQGKLQGVAQPVSDAMQKYLQSVDWQHASRAAAATWNNRVYFAVPMKGQAAASVTNNALLVFNTLTGGWEGRWQGSEMKVHAFARHAIAGEERLLFANETAQVLWLSDGWTDLGAYIATSFATRRYFGGARVLALKAQLQWETSNVSLTVKARAPGYNEESTLLLNHNYDRSASLVYDGSTAATAAHKEDYSVGVVTVATGNYVVSGAGSAASNGTYNFRASTVPLWFNESNGSLIRKNTTQWIMRVFVPPYRTEYFNTDISGDTPPLTGWQLLNGAAPAPTIAAETPLRQLPITSGVPLDQHQSITETVRLRVLDHGVQLLVENAQGSCRLKSIAVAGVPRNQSNSRMT